MRVHLSDSQYDGLIYDLEVAPALGFYYPPYYKTNILWTEREQYLMSFAYAWTTEIKTYDEKYKEMVYKNPKAKYAPPIYYHDLRQYANHNIDPENDEELVRALFDIWEHAEYLIAYNGKRFDDKMAMAFFMRHELITQHKTSIDPYQLLRSAGRFNGYSMQKINEYFGIETKEEVSLLKLQRSIIENDDDESWDLLEKYNRQDIVALWANYKRVRPYAKNHPNMALRVEGTPFDACPRCGAEGTVVEYNRTSKTNSKVYRQYYCALKKGGCGFKPTARKSMDITSPRFK